MQQPFLGRSNKHLGERIKFALIGAGSVADLHARCLADLPDAQLVTVYSRSETRARAIASKYTVKWSTQLDEVLSQRDVQVAIIATAPYNHAPHAMACMCAGKHVLIEKPMGISVTECDELIECSKQTGCTLGVVFQNRFKDQVRLVKEFIAGGKLVAVLHISGYVKWYRPQSYYEASDWRGRLNREGGGAIFSQAGHTLDLMQWLGGRIEWVFTNAVTTQVHQNIEIENLGIVTMRFASGATGMLEASTAIYPGDAERLEIHGTRGTIVLTAGVVTRWDIKDAIPKESSAIGSEMMSSGASDPMAISDTWHRAQLVDFMEAVRTSRPPAVDGLQARELNVLCEAIYESSHRLHVTFPRY